jgi:hypothetical protein
VHACWINPMMTPAQTAQPAQPAQPTPPTGTKQQ